MLLFLSDGFHKMSTVDNNTMDVEKDEIKFFHPYFQKDQPDLLKLIKRKVSSFLFYLSRCNN